MEYIITEATSKLTKTNSPYLHLKLRGVNCVKSLNVWGTGSIKPSDVYNKVVTLSLFPEDSSIKWKSLVLSSLDALPANHPLLSIPLQGRIDGAALYNILKQACKLPMSEEWAKFLSSPQILQICKMYENYPAGLKMHHTWWKNGLSTHVGEALEAYIALSSTPQCSLLKHHVVITALFFHDFGKCYEYESTSDNQITDSLPLFGHVYLSTKAFLKIAAQYDLPSRDVQFVEHAILAHHGSLEHGSPIIPATSEAFYVHICDLISARQSAYENSEHMERNYSIGTTIVKQ